MGEGFLHTAQRQKPEGGLRVSDMDAGPGQHHNPLVNPENTLVTSVTKVTLHTPVSQVRICTIVWNTDIGDGAGASGRKPAGQ